jgi:hypothetical protein
VIDYQVWHSPMPGLYMKLSAGNFAKGKTGAPTICVSENAFGFLEPSVAAACPAYRQPYNHWGATFIGSEYWTLILQSWDKIKQTLQVARSAEEVPDIGYIEAEVKKEFGKNFSECKIRLAELISQMSEWLRAVLLEFDGVSILGI